jgi:trk system potassium uptake protein TrkH
MKVQYKNQAVEQLLVSTNLFVSILVAGTFVFLYGFDEPLLPVMFLHIAQVAAMFVFLFEKTLRFMNAFSKRQYLAANWFEIPLLAALLIIFSGARSWFGASEPARLQMLALGVYLVLQVVIKTCRSCVNLAASGKNPAKALIVSFLVLIITGSGLLMLPRSYNTETMSFVDAVFTATSATCVTGLIVRDTGRDFSLMGQVVILTLIQLGGLGIVVFGAVLALLLGQALSVRESVAMQDLLSARTLGRISRLIGFIFITTIVVEAIGAAGLFRMFRASESGGSISELWFCSVFHSISAFCNAGFSLFGSSMIEYHDSTGVYAVIVPLIILGGLGFGVLYNLVHAGGDRLAVAVRKKSGVVIPSFHSGRSTVPSRLRLQTKIVLVTSCVLIIAGTMVIMLFESVSTKCSSGNVFMTAFFQSITARTAGFNTIDISSMSEASKLVLMALMFIGGSPGSTAGGIKTVTLTVVIMVAYATLRKRKQVEIFKRSVSPAVVGRAITVTLLFVIVFLAVSLCLTVTEERSGFAVTDIMFETMSALGTVGLSSGVTGALTTAGKVLIIITMLIGRLGPLTLLAAMTFNVKAVGYDYPTEPIVVG